MQLELYRENLAEDMLAIYGYSVTETAFTFDRNIPSKEEFDQRMKGSHVCLVLLLEEKVAGFAYGGRHRAKAAYDTVSETSIYLSPTVHGRGYGAKLYGALLEILAKLGIYSALGGITDPNPASEALHSKLGYKNLYRFENIGFKQGSWQTVNWWRKDLKPFDGPPTPISKIADMSPHTIKEILNTFAI